MKYTNFIFGSYFGIHVCIDALFISSLFTFDYRTFSFTIKMKITID